MREPSRSAVSAEAEARLLDKREPQAAPMEQPRQSAEPPRAEESTMPSVSAAAESPFGSGSLLQKKKRDRLLLVSFRMPQGLKEKLELAAKRHEVNQTDLINEAIELNLQRYL